MTAQHRGFAAAARGLGADPTVWQAHSSDGYAVAARDVLEAFSADGIDDAPFALPEFGPDAVFPGSIAMGFHFVDYVVHAWDVAASLGVDYELPEHVLAAALPLVLAIPDGDVRDLENVPFDRAVQSGGGADDFSRILRHLGRDPQWSRR